MTFPANTAVTINSGSYSSVNNNSYQIEFFIKYDAPLPANSTGIQITGTAVQNMGILANTTGFYITNVGYALRALMEKEKGAGMSSLHFPLANTWYHVAYIGIGNNTYFAVNGRVNNVGRLGGQGAYTDNGIVAAGGFPKIGNDYSLNPAGNIHISNFRMMTNNVTYNLVGFAPPTAQLTAVSNTTILLANSTFRNEANGVSLTLINTPTITTGDIVYRYPAVEAIVVTNTGITNANTAMIYSNATSNSSTITYSVRSRGSGANQISKQSKSIATINSYSNATSNSATITYFVRSLGSGANQISKQVKSIATANSYANATSNSSTITYFVRSIGSGANQISKQSKSIATANSYANATSNSSTITYFVRSLGSGANQISKQYVYINGIYYDKDGRLINQFTWGA
jgi:hypothetical protein